MIINIYIYFKSWCKFVFYLFCSCCSGRATRLDVCCYQTLYVFNNIYVLCTCYRFACCNDSFMLLRKLQNKKNKRKKNTAPYVRSQVYNVWMNGQHNQTSTNYFSAGGEVVRMFFVLCCYLVRNELRPFYGPCVYRQPLYTVFIKRRKNKKILNTPFPC